MFSWEAAAGGEWADQGSMETPVQAGDFPKFPSQKMKTSLGIRGELFTEGKTKLTNQQQSGGGLRL